MNERLPPWWGDGGGANARTFDGTGSGGGGIGTSGAYAAARSIESATARMRVIESRKVCPRPTTTAYVRDCISPGAIVNGPDTIIMPAPGFHESVLLVYPARVGAHWKSSVRSDSDYDFEVEAIEPVRTLVGTFPAARVRGFLHSGQPGTEPERIWYGKPGVVRSREKRVDEAGLSNGQRGIRETITNAILTSFVPGSPQAFFVPTAQ